MAKKKAALLEEILEIDARHVEFDYLQVDERLQIGWTGVTGCCKKARVDREIKNQFNKWMAEQKRRHPHPVAAYWHEAPQATCYSQDDRPIGGRSCWVQGSMNCSIMFLLNTPKPST